MNDPRPATEFTGRHMAIIIIAFFSVVIAVNLVMARFAIGTFGGTVVDNSYVASQKFNGWLEQARAQDALGWQSSVVLDPARYVVVTVEGAADTPVHPPMEVRAIANHPVGRTDSISLSFRVIAPGTFRSNEALPQGRWKLHLSIQQGENALKRIEDVQ